MCLNDVSTENLACANTTVVWTLRSWVAAFGPTIWPSVRIQNSVFLLQTEPRLVFGVGFHQPLTLVTIIEFVGASIGIPSLGHDQDVVATTERIGKDGDGANVDIGIVAWGLTGRRTIEVPFR